MLKVIIFVLVFHNLYCANKQSNEITDKIGQEIITDNQLVNEVNTLLDNFIPIKDLRNLILDYANPEFENEYNRIFKESEQNKNSKEGLLKNLDEIRSLIINFKKIKDYNQKFLLEMEDLENQITLYQLEIVGHEAEILLRQLGVDIRNEYV